MTFEYLSNKNESYRIKIKKSDIFEGWKKQYIHFR
jgi:hypothetical protein